MFRLYSVPVILVVALLITYTTVSADQFIYNPPDSTKFVETATMVRTKDLGGVGKQVDQTKQIMDVVLTKTDEGYSGRSTLREMEFMRDGKLVQQPFFDAMLNMTIEYAIAPDGNLTDIIGLGEVLDKMLADTPNLPPAVMNAINEESMKKKSMVEYQGRIGDFIGREYEIGDVWTAESEFSMPDGSLIQYLTVIRFKEMVPCGNQQCVKVEYVYDADPTNLKSFIADVFEELDVSAKMYIENMKPMPMKISGSGSRLLDPNTMLIYGETLQRRMEMTMNIPERGPVPMVMTETRTYEFQYE